MGLTYKINKTALNVDKAILFVNYVLVILLLLSYLAPVINPQKFWPVALLGLAYPFLLIANLIFVVYWAIRVKKHVFMSLACILIGFKLLVNTYGFHSLPSPGQKKAAQYIRVINYNVHNFNISQPGEDVTKPLIFKLINDEQPDVICFEEYYTWRAQNPYRVCDTLKKILKTSNYYVEPFDSTTTYQIGLAIYSKYPIVNRGVIQITTNKSDNPGVYCDVKANGKIIRVYCLHLQSMQFEPKDYSYIESAGAKANVHSAWHVVQKLKAAFIQRSKQVAIVKAHALQCPYPYIFAGDFNDTPASYAVNQLANGITNSFAKKGHGMGTTFNGNIPNYQIDYIMATPQFEVMSYSIIKQKLSDHYPVYADLLLH